MHARSFHVICMKIFMQSKQTWVVNWIKTANQLEKHSTNLKNTQLNLWHSTLKISEINCSSSILFLWLILSLSFQSVTVIRWVHCTTAVTVPASVSVKRAQPESNVMNVSPVTTGNRVVSVSTFPIGLHLTLPSN